MQLSQAHVGNPHAETTGAVPDGRIDKLFSTGVCTYVHKAHTGRMRTLAGLIKSGQSPSIHLYEGRESKPESSTKRTECGVLIRHLCCGSSVLPGILSQ